MKKFRYWILLYPDIATPIGGVKQIHRLAEAFTQIGRQITIVQENQSFHPNWFKSKVNTISLSDWTNLKDIKADTDIIIMPETFLPLIQNTKEGVKKIIFNQNGAYSFGPINLKHDFGTPDNVLEIYRHPDLIHTLCVSEHDSSLLTGGLRMPKAKVSKLTNPIETDLFYPCGNKKRIFSFMPRKNQRDALIVTSLLKNQPWFKSWELQEIKNLNQSDVISCLQKSICLLSFGHPEGFGLPLAEAAACGCALIGYTGLGGREIFDLGEPYNSAWRVEYGDWLRFIESAQELIQRSESDSKTLALQLNSFSNKIRQTYSSANMLDSLREAILKWEAYL